MVKLLKGLSVLEVIIGVVALVIGVLAIAGAGIMAPAAVSEAEGEVVTTFRVEGALLIISGIFNLACGLNGFGGAKGNRKKLGSAIKLGWVGLIAAAISAAMLIIGNVNVSSITSAVASSVVPVLFLVSAYSSKK